MQRYLAALTIVVLLGTVQARVAMLPNWVLLVDLAAATRQVAGTQRW